MQTKLCLHNTDGTHLTETLSHLEMFTFLIRWGIHVFLLTQKYIIVAHPSSLLGWEWLVPGRGRHPFLLPRGGPLSNSQAHHRPSQRWRTRRAQPKMDIVSAASPLLATWVAFAAGKADAPAIRNHASPA